MRMSQTMPEFEDVVSPHQRWLSLIGIGEDGADGLSPVARTLINGAELVVGGARHLALADLLIRGRKMPWPSPITDGFQEIVACRGRPVAVLASGDPFHFGVGKALSQIVPPDEMTCLPRPSAFSLAASRLGWALQDTVTLSIHGRALEGVIRHLHDGARLLILSWDGTSPNLLARLVVDRGMAKSMIWVLEALGGPRERVRQTTAEAFDLDDIDSLNTIAIEIDASDGALEIGLAPGLDDGLFESDGQLTKREVRAVTLSSLSPCRGELLWDIGLGSGSIAIEWMLCHPSLRAIGIEALEERAARAARNAAALGVPTLDVRTGRAPDVLEGLPIPDAVFIGGGLTVAQVFECAWERLRAGGRLVANSVTLEGDARLLELARLHGGELTRIEVSRAEAIGRFTGWRPAMPVTQWRVRKP